MGAERFDMVVIGAGPAGEKAATQAAWYGKTVAIVERRPDPGGIAVSDAGIPTKTLRETAAYLTGFRHRDVYGVSLSLDPNLKIERLKRRTSEVKAIMTAAVRGNLSRMGVGLIHGTARLLGGGAVRVGERTLAASVILLAPGSRPARPGAIPFDDPAISDSERILELGSLPKTLLVVGGGAIGCEYASIFTALGTQVTLVERSDRLLAFADGEVAGVYADVFRAQGTDVRLSTSVESIGRVAGKLEVRLSGGGPPLAPEHVLFAGGRIGNTEDLGLAEAGVEVDAKGRIKVDEHYRTTAAGIYAAGDVIGPPALASVSQEQGRVAACHAFGIPFKDVVDPVPPFGVYSIPELAMAGLTEDAAKQQGIDVETGRGLFAKNTRARIAGTTEGMIKLVFRRADRVLLGVHIVGDVASELIHLGQLCISHALTIDTFIHSTFNTPTFTEAYKYAAYDGLQRLAGRTPGPISGPASR